MFPEASSFHVTLLIFDRTDFQISLDVTNLGHMLTQLKDRIKVNTEKLSLSRR